MCGITGIYHFNKSRKIDRTVLQRMTDKLEHRGPDGEGFIVNDNVGLGHRRLSIIDIGNGDQPIFSEDGNKCIVFNGEIYNYLEIRQDLSDIGYNFTTDSDTEVLLKAYEEWGVDCLEKLNGMWSFIILDIITERLFVSRDRVGIKPLYYMRYDDSIYFSSEIKSFTEVCDLSIDKYEAWDRLVLGPLFSEKTMYENVFELLPGTYMEVDANKVATFTFWSLFKTLGANKTKFDLAKIDGLLKDSVKLRLVSDVPLGTINSGGLDSSLISALTTREYKGKLRSFSVAPEKIGDDILPGDESFYAEKVAVLIDSEHETLRYTGDKLLGELKSATYYNDDILFHSNSIPLALMFHEIKKTHKIKVVLGGEGADEIFRGYSVNKFAFIYSKTPVFLKKLILKYFQFKIANYRFSDELFPDVSVFLKLAISRNAHLKPSEADKLLGIKGKPSRERFHQIELSSSLDTMNQLVYYEQANYLKALLHRVDRMSMKGSVEARVPFLDHRIIEYVNSIHHSKKSSLTEASVKKILKNISKEYLDGFIIRRKKYGFASPLNRFREELHNNITDQALDFDKLSSQELFVINSYKYLTSK